MLLLCGVAVCSRKFCTWFASAIATLGFGMNPSKPCATLLTGTCWAVPLGQFASETVGNGVEGLLKGSKRAGTPELARTKQPLRSSGVGTTENVLTGFVLFSC